MIKCQLMIFLKGGDIFISFTVPIVDVVKNYVYSKEKTGRVRRFFGRKIQEENCDVGAYVGAS